MRYLKTYNKLFESDEFATSDELDNIEEILLNIEDLNLYVEIHKNVGGENEELESESEIARVYIEKSNEFDFTPEEREFGRYSPDENAYFPNKEFISTLQHLTSYVTEIGYNIEIESVHRSHIIDRVSSEDNEISDDDLLVFEYKAAPISYIKIIITYKD